MENLKVLQIETWIDEFGENQLNLDKLQEYLDFIKEAVDRYDSERYSEWHHVMPKCIDKDHKYNDEVVRINGADHFRAHSILPECFINCGGTVKRKLLYAFHGMVRGSSIRKDLTPEDFEKLRQAMSEAISYTEVSEVTRKRMSEARKGMKLSEETRNKMSKSQKRRMKLLGHPMQGKTFTEEQRMILSESHKGILHTEEWKINQSSKLKGNKFVQGKVWINNGINEKLVDLLNINEYLNEGWLRGRLTVSEETKTKLSKSHPKSYSKRNYHLVCKNCHKDFIGNSSNQRFCDNCKN